MKRTLPILTSLALAGTLASCGKTDILVQAPVIPTQQSAAQNSGSVLDVNPTVEIEKSSSGMTQSGSTASEANGTINPFSGAQPNPAGTETKTTKTVSYDTPAGPDSVEFSVGVSQGKITSVSVTPLAEHSVSKKMQEKFSAAISSAAVGQSISGLKLDAVGGASLTTAAFDQFVNSLNS